jgi:hypothetical protein
MPELEFAYTAAKHSDSAKILITTSLPTAKVFGVSTGTESDQVQAT